MLKIANQAGIGLRHPHLQQVIDEKPNIAWLEVHSENFFLFGVNTKQLDNIRQLYPLSMHGVGLSLGSADPINKTHLAQLKKAINRYEPYFVSEHLSWGSIEQTYFNDLLPMLYTEKSLYHFADKVKQVQDYLGRQLLIENPSAYLQFEASDIDEWEFYAQLPKLTGCGLLFDINNIYVNSKNFDFDPLNYINSTNKDDIFEIHIAGHSINSYDKGVIYIDDHGSKASKGVWDLFTKVIKKIGQKPTLIEWDSNIPDLSVLLKEAQKAQEFLETV